MYKEGETVGKWKLEHTNIPLNFSGIIERKINNKNSSGVVKTPWV